jgi:hypothetical protein
MLPAADPEGAATAAAAAAAAAAVAAAGGVSGSGAVAEEAVDLTAETGSGGQRRSKRQRPVLDLSNSPKAPLPADADVMLVESVDLAAEEPPHATAAAAEANGNSGDVLISQVGESVLPCPAV